MSKMVEFRESIDYTFVIHRQLDRVASIRSQLFTDKAPEVPGQVDVMLERTLDYLAAVEALYAILLPELRGKAGEYIKAAYKALMIAEFGKKKGKKNDDDAEALPPEVRKYVSEVGGTVYCWHPIVWTLDLAVQEMLKGLNAAGLLIRGREVAVGAAGATH